jgi:hypothetical protein
MDIDRACTGSHSLRAFAVSSEALRHQAWAGEGLPAAAVRAVPFAVSSRLILYVIPRDSYRMRLPLPPVM